MKTASRRGASTEALGCATGGTPTARVGGWSRQPAPLPLPADVVADLRRLDAEAWRDDEDAFVDWDYSKHDGERTT